MITRGTYCSPYAELPKKAFRRVCVASALHEDIQHVAVLIDGSPQIRPFSIDGEKDARPACHLSPHRGRRRRSSFAYVCPNAQAPLTHGFVGHDDPALGQKLFDIAKTEREAEIQPDCVADDFRRKAVASVIGSSGGCFHEAILTHCSATFQVDNIEEHAVFQIATGSNTL